MKKELLAVLGCGILAVGLASCGTEEAKVEFDYTNNLEVKAQCNSYSIEIMEQAITEVENGEAYLYQHNVENDPWYTFGDNYTEFCINHFLVENEQFKRINIEDMSFAVVKSTIFESHAEYVVLPQENALDVETLSGKEREYLFYTPKEKFTVTFNTYKVFEHKSEDSLEVTYTYEQTEDITLTYTNTTYEKEVDLIARAKALTENVEEHLWDPRKF